MGFLSAYERPRRLDLGGGFWVEYKPCLTGRERDWLRNKFMTSSALPDGRIVAQVTDYFGNLRESTLLAITSWNLTDDTDTPLPFAHDVEEEAKTGKPSPLRESYSRLPAIVQDKIEEEVASADAEPTNEEHARFPEGDGGSGAVGDDPAPDDSQGVD